MNACPVCRAAWPHASSLSHAVCPACFAVFQKHEGQWRQVPPGWHAQAPIPFPLGTILRLRSIDHRVVGFACYSYEVEYGRDQWETYERHEYTLSDVAGGNPRLLCWTSFSWFLARPVDAEASSLHLDPHLPQGAVDYQLKILNAQGAVLESHKDFLDMNPKRHTLKLSLPAGAAAVEATCTVHYGIAGVPSWPVELRFFH